MRFSSVVVLILTISGLAASSTIAQSPKEAAGTSARREVAAIRVPDGAIRIDGHDDDWMRIAPDDLKRCESRPDPSRLWLVRSRERDEFGGADDCSVVLHIAHDKDHLYILADVRDQYLVNQSDEATPNFGDDLELFVDANGPEKQFGETNNENVRQMMFVPGRLNPKWKAPFIWQKEKNPGVKAASHFRPWGYTMEIEVPKALFPYWKDHPELDSVGIEGVISDADAPGIDIHDPSLKGALFFFSYYEYHFLSPRKFSLLKLEEEPVALSRPQPSGAPAEPESVPCLLQTLESPAAWKAPAASVVAKWSLEQQKALLFLVARRTDAEITDYPSISTIKELVAKNDMQSCAAAQYALEALAARHVLPVEAVYHVCGQSKVAQLVITYAWCAGANGDAAAATPRLIELLQHKNIRVRMMAALAMGMLKDDAAIEPLMKLAEREPDTDVQKQALDSLKKLRADKPRAGDASADLTKTIADAKPGHTITLPAGQLKMGGLIVPSGVNIRGAGVGKTIIDAAGFPFGVIVEGAKNVKVSDLTVSGATVANIQVRRSEQVTVAEVMVREGLSGISFSDVTGGRIENCISVENRCGILITGGSKNAVVNCSVIKNAGIGISLPSGAGATVFNNVIAGNATGVYLGLDLRESRLDYNLYFNLYMGKLGDQLARPHLGDWKSLSDQDAHSVQFPVTFRDEKNDDYSIINALDWSQDRAVSSDWGADQLGDVKAPEADISGQRRHGAPDVGAYETVLTTARPADGAFEVKSGQGLTSAGIFSAEGRELAYLFQNLPLRKGHYPFWFPPRTFEGKFIPAGKYELRMAESDLSWEYLGWIGDTGKVANARQMATIGACYSLFEKDVLYVASGWSEDDTCLRCYRLSDQKVLWSMPGRDGARGLVKGEDGYLYILRPVGEKGQLLRIDPATGKTAPPWGANKTGQITFEKGASLRDLANIDGKFFACDPAAGVIRYGNAQSPIPWAGSFPAPKAQFMGLDASTKLLWVVTSEGMLVALKPSDGSTVSQYDPKLADVAALTVADRTIALASRSTGKVHFFDTSDPANIKVGKTFGRGDGPYGLYLPDRFTFQKPSSGFTNIALSAAGDLSVVDGRRQLVFDPAEKFRWLNFGIGSNPFPSFADPLRMYMENYTFLVDEKNGTWKPEGFWDIPWPNPDISKFLGDFKFKDRTFLVYGLKDRFEVYEFTGNSGGAGAKLVFSLAGNPRLPDRASKLLANGDVVASNKSGWATVWKFGGLDAAGNPVYRDADALSIPHKPESVISPFTFEVSDKANLSLGTVTRSGGIVGNVWLGTSPYGTGWSNTAGTDMAEINPDGTLRWFHPLGMYGGTPGFADLNGIYLEGVCTQPQLIAVNPDGLGLGTAGLPAKVNYDGFWMDYEGSLQGYIGKDGHRYAIIGDNIKGCGHWFRLHNDDKILTTAQPVELSEEAAGRLKSIIVAKPAKIAFRPPTPTVHIPKLDKPLPIDGDLAKWRALGITPQIVITPETANGGIKGPTDASAIVRMAHLGSDLYVQILRFDNVVTFHQAMSKMYMQDNAEMCLNGFMDGMKVMVSPTSDTGTAMLAEKFLGTAKLLPEQHAPRIVKVLDDASSVTEREMIEGVYGVDMSGCRVIVTEFKLPIDKESFEANPSALFAAEQGSTFWLGFMIDDNDEPGADIQRYMYWPATYSTFQPKEDGAKAIFE